MGRKKFSASYGEDQYEVTITAESKDGKFTLNLVVEAAEEFLKKLVNNVKEGLRKATEEITKNISQSGNKELESFLKTIQSVAKEVQKKIEEK